MKTNPPEDDPFPQDPDPFAGMDREMPRHGGAEQRDANGSSQAGNNGNQQGPSAQTGRFDDTEIIEKFGEPYTVTPKGFIEINQKYFVARFATEHLVLHESKEREFYIHDYTSGAWVMQTPDAVKEMFSNDWQNIAGEYHEPGLLPKRTNGLLESLSSQLRGHVEKNDMFKPNGRVIHFLNGMLHISANCAKLMRFSPDYYSRNVCPFDWNPNAQCPRFLDVLVKPAMPDYDVDLLQRMFGSHLLGRNIAQRFLLLTGTPGGGKSTAVSVLESIVGLDNVIQLRTNLLNERFELARLIGKTTLSGKDVPSNFLETAGAQVLKSLVGGDIHSPELKFSNAKNLRIRGCFNVIVTANTRLRFRLQDDDDAWARRTTLIPYERPKPKVRIGDFAQQLIETEGPGICRWFVEGAMRYLQECDQFGDIQLNDIQQQRVTSLINESNSLKSFIHTEVCHHQGGTLATSEIVKAYIVYCQQRDWSPLPMKSVERQLPDLMMDSFHSPLRHDINRFGKNTRGYMHVALTNDDEFPE
jgi:putative DNA primase/helicase